MTSGAAEGIPTPLTAGEERPGQSMHAGVDVLLVEDDDELAHQTSSALQSAGFTVRRSATVCNAASQIETKTPDVLILDRMLPDGEALEYLQTLRSKAVEVPTLIVSALGETQDRIRGLEHGADDYLPKPFDSYELVARISALLRRATTSSGRQTLHVGDLELDIVTRKVLKAGQELVLQPREFKLLEFLMRNAGEVVTRTMLLKNVWNLEFDPQTNVVEVHISRLRSKLDRGCDQKLLHTVRGNGYSLHP